MACRFQLLWVLCLLVHAGARSCTSGDFRCPGASCVPADNRCDFTDQCGDGSDEKDCSGFERCDFERDLCGMSLCGDNPATWTRVTGLTNTGPTQDHTGSCTGHYLSLSVQNERRSLAALRSAVFLPTNSCQMTFYHHFGKITGTLRVLTQTHLNGNYTHVWTRTLPEQDPWQRSVLVFNSTHNFQVIIQGEIFNTSDPSEGLAIDDVSFGDGCDASSDSTLPCTEGFKMCNGKCILTNKFCNFIHDCLPDLVDESGCPMTCDFESGLCGWSTVGTDSGWKWVKAEDAVLNGSAPSQDHSNRSSQGHYLWVGGEGAGSAVLCSSVHRSTASSCTLRFHYSLQGNGTLRAWLRAGLEKQMVFHTEKETENEWMEGEIPLLIGLEEFQIAFEGRVVGGGGFLALDSFLFSDCGEALVPGVCPEGTWACGNESCVPRSALCDFQPDCRRGTDEDPLLCSSYTTCDFESDWCGWEQLNSGNANWSRVNYPESPGADHTIGTGNGSFAFISTSIQPEQTIVAQLASPALRKAQEQSLPCQLRFWYRLSGQAELVLFTRTALGGDLRKCTVINEPTINAGWERAEVNIDPVALESGIPFQVLFQASLHAAHAMVALDDISLMPECHPANTTPPETSTDITDYGPVMLLSGGSLSDSLGLTVDGNWLAKVSHVTDDPSAVFRLVSPGLYQGLVGSVSLLWAVTSSFYLAHPPSGPRGLFVEEIPGHGADSVRASFWPHRDKWLPGFTALEAVGVPGHYIHRLDGNVSVAKDDGSQDFRERASWRIIQANMSMTSPAPQCPPLSFRCRNGECIDRSKMCDFTPHCSAGEDEADCPAHCDFERDSCGWYEFAEGDGFDWYRSSAAEVPVEFQRQSPPQDHTTNTTEGHFMFVLKNRSNLAQKAYLRGPKFQQSSSGCMVTFWHYNYGLSVGAADMYLRIDGVENVTVVWRTLYNQGSSWHPVTVQLGRITRPFQFSLVKLSLGMFDGVSALDDITFHNCSLPPPVAQCDSHERFHCKRSRACIDRQLVCDLVDDCGDGSDEEGCSPELMCNFEEGLCNWMQDKLDDVFDWTRIQGPTPTLNTGPWKDHTLGNVNGHYLFIEASVPQQFRDTALLVSRGFQPTANRGQGSRPCTFRFHYHMFGKHIFSLAVYLRTTASGRGQLLWVRWGEQGNLWHRKTLYLSSIRPFQVLVEGTVGDDFNGDIAIDDLSFLDCIPYDGDLPSEVPTTPPGTVTTTTERPNSCSEGELVCDVTGDCVDRQKSCDFRHDCSAGTDELYCVNEVCDFEGGNTCGWSQSWPSTVRSIHSFSWLSGQGKSIHHGEEFHRPATDHTHGTPEGWYMYADSSNGGYGHITDLLTPVISATGPRCTLVFWYHMSGFTVGTLQVLGKFENVTHELWSQTGSQGSRWKRGEVFLGIRHNFQMILRAKRGISYMGDVVLDDVSFQNCMPLLVPDRPCRTDEYACANKYCIPKDHLCDFINDCGDWSDENPYICRGFNSQCNFEFDLCSWRQCRQDNFDWLIKAGSTPTGGTGPSTDHTLRDPSGHYIYLESSFPQSAGDVARISGPTFSWRSRECKMVFYLHMSGDGVGTLSVFRASGTQHQLLLNLTGDQGNYWQRREVDLAAPEDFQVMFEGSIGKGNRGDICLDDITFSPGCLLSSSPVPMEPTLPPTSGYCSYGFLECGNGKCFRPEQSCDFVDDCGDGTDERDCGTSCTFERGRCGWKSSLADNFDWTLGLGSIQSFRPHADHTLENEEGHFVYLEATPVGLKGDKAHMRSSVWKESSVTCKLTFWYYISSKATGAIRLLVKVDSGLTEVWKKSGDQGERWNKAEVPLRKMRNFQLIFEGIRAQDVSGGAAVDDIEYSNCAPSSELPASCPAATDFVCRNGDCIESHLMCDSKADCADESDETDCSHILDLPGACSFSTPESWEDTCQLAQDHSDDFDWRIGWTRVTPGTGPLSDHSPDGRGNFLYVYSAVQREGDIATFTTKTPFPASIGVCHLRFWYYMYGSARMGTLKVYTVGESGTPLLMWAINGNRGDRWNYANVILSSSGAFRVAFQAEVGGDMRTDIALDDISFSTECSVGGPVTPETPTCGADSFQCLHSFQCIPQSWWCDGEVDCRDLSDEELCPSRVPGTLPPQGHCGEQQYQCSDGICLPSLLRCDGVPDCAGGEDEFSCPLQQCIDGALVCEEKTSCIAPEQRCNGFIDCYPFEPDESSCLECPAGYCMNEGVCLVEQWGPFCRCVPGWRGNRCHLKEKPSPPVPPPGPGDIGQGKRPESPYIGLGAGLVFLVLGMVVAVFAVFRRKCSSAKSEEMNCGVMDNPVFDLFDQRAGFPSIEKVPGTSISVYPWKTEMEGLDMRNSKLSFSNPLYQSHTGEEGLDSRSSVA
ncbi:MAM and LDL-receptor class A domain-containing protein 1 isoform X1 [Anguilla anguilla]|uniref:MAM and LDL-receptor class A domain-containing protein 1 isoform X1 n=1 Tax=Anguilla anguilla TaxID=7936 RepID=UPI0015AD4BC8|nr:MAM and LDL-receptor class A domain-containing protein 1 isoform X1 [Anguilla anguilla]